MGLGLRRLATDEFGADGPMDNSETEAKRGGVLDSVSGWCEPLADAKVSIGRVLARTLTC